MPVESQVTLPHLLYRLGSSGQPRYPEKEITHCKNISVTGSTADQGCNWGFSPSSCHLLQLCRRALQRFFCCNRSGLRSTFKRPRGRVRNDWIFTFGWTYPGSDIQEVLSSEQLEWWCKVENKGHDWHDLLHWWIAVFLTHFDIWYRGIAQTLTSVWIRPKLQTP